MTGDHVSLQFYPEMEFSYPLGYVDFITMQQKILEQDGTGSFYIDGVEEPVSHGEMRDRRRYDDAFVRYSSETEKYFYQVMKNGEELIEVDGLTKEELLDALSKLK